MSKELIERLRADAESTDDIGLCADAADRIEELERERDAFYMDYRMKCDEQTKSLCVERDALQADNARLREVLVKHVAPYLGHKEVYDEVLASIPAQSLARLRNRVLNKAINVAWNNEPECNGPIEMALRKLKEPE